MGKNHTQSEEKNSRAHSILEEIERLKLWEKLRCVHVNDSKDPYGSGRDRHENIGDGHIPQEDLRYFVQHDLIKDKPMILEVPGIEEKGPDAENIRRLQKLVTD